MPKKTLWRWLEKIEKARRISLVSDMKLVNVPTATGAKSTTFYNLNVLNQLAMACRVCRDRDMAVINGKEYSNDLLEYSESRGNPNLTVISDSADLAESGNSRITLISESGLYLIFAKCNLPKCEPDVDEE